MRIRLLLSFICSAFFCQAQDSTLVYSTAILLSGSASHTAFWIHANQNGNIPSSGNFGSGRWAISKIYNPNNPRLFQWSGSIQLISNYAKKGDLFLSDAYLAAKLGIVELSVGQKNQVTGLMDTTLTSGSMSVSGNARPFPRLQLSIPDFVPLYFANDLVAIKASYSDGMLRGSDILYGPVRHIPHTYFHQKTFYVRIGNKKSRFNVLAGVNHQVVWGGEDKIWPLYNIPSTEAYYHVITGKIKDYKRIGNHFGTYDLGITRKGKYWEYFIYRQNIFENGSLFQIQNFSDGLNGIRIKRRNYPNQHPKKLIFKSLLLEFLSTKSQANSNPPFGLIQSETGNFYNHYIYKNGWSYRGQNMGTPLSSEAGTTAETLPKSSSEFTNNNRLIAFHSGITANWHHTEFLLKATYSRNFGSYLTPFEQVKPQVSLLLVAEKKLSLFGGITTFIGFSSDIGKLYSKNNSLMIGLKKSGFLD
ncbi:hypothetical protein DYBT9275_03841 [Dyadobacter sp. CECT 9275]|uniref:Capsule assembly protein Wzi n=1 Tax=Dyadobacter helix TaxID=2822344 RepID=A0A916JGZ1_9BACT|nr:capsule assembly Wzi family protein [Dyadobacter sp. CECT 9275]CAG5006539.1 hypothetical protein DYBT9275_03841 [Dyadobacter sp. CECT 9275]